uniref:U2 small nuclear RNA auxiliary factor 1 n=1 Tax=Sparus aurata TaxID=8175 RepID=A0A671W024_SPAAU
MAEYLASIFGTEKDKVNCSFYFKIGACRHGDRCSRLHNKPTFSQTIALLNIYRNPQNSAQSADGLTCAISDMEMQEHYDEFFEEVFTEMEEKYGEVEEMNVCDNLGDHLVGNVYVKFRYEEDAEKAVMDLNNRWFNGQPIHAELSPVTDFREACCRQYEMGECTRGGFCNFMHLKPISRELRRELYGRRRKGYKHIHYLLYSGTLSVCLCSCFPAVHNHFSFTPTAVTGLGLDRERGDLALGTEVEEADVTTRGVVPETENVPGDSEPQSHD